jgi:tetratricopeptide (TPR) repeat protein
MDVDRRRAVALYRQATDHLLEGELDLAIELYSESIDVCPTAEAYTFRGWAYSFSERYQEAIDECKTAIATDPDFGNPYNDIGSYLVALGRPDQAIEWFERAKNAPRYEPRHYPFLNLGRLYALRGYYDLAAMEFEQALKLSPDDSVASAFLEKHPLQPN